MAPITAMADFPSDEVVTLKGTRLEGTFKRMFLAVDAVGLSTAKHCSKHVNWDVPQNAIIRGIKRAIRIPLYAFIKAALAEERDGDVEILFTDVPVAGEIQDPLEAPLIASFVQDTIASSFILCYEEHLHEVRQRCGSVMNFEPRWAFARIIRNGIAHGRINITDPRQTKVQWQGISIEPSDNGKSIFRDVFTSVDLLLLMIDMDLALSQMGVIGDMPRLTGIRRSPAHLEPGVQEVSMATIEPNDFLVQVNKQADRLRLVPVFDGTQGNPIEMPMTLAQQMMTLMLTAVALTYENEPAPTDGPPSFIPPNTPWVAPLRFSFSSRAEVPLLNFEFGAINLHFAIDRDTISHVLSKFLEATQPAT